MTSFDAVAVILQSHSLLSSSRSRRWFVPLSLDVSELNKHHRSDGNVSHGPRRTTTSRGKKPKTRTILLSSRATRCRLSHQFRREESTPPFTATLPVVGTRLKPSLAEVSDSLLTPPAPPSPPPPLRQPEVPFGPSLPE